MERLLENKFKIEDRLGAANSCVLAAPFSNRLAGRAGIGLKTAIKDMDQGGPTRCIIGILCRQPA